ncbi:Piso0_003774 [Millerozyma farinosa CBS 7064]|uniref:Piso0_003774 protein n=1 Tax=Pichia sorbitophila (strain ATCC MYA-4447 / BCRC 22081 / CBS 7064 / NBRC 10061 / NRRL Y-12695) TaxID=559304 RepID=G8Y896_PICSO|nr:Piso0_003774 [Millerozyma farinosa CBS 7064]CCE84233.1 Piso0_003774 [Millerozyma farinosa CBS 7064]
MLAWISDGGYFDYLPDMHNMANMFMTFTPLFSYGTTCYGIYKKQSSTGFSIDICATMLMSSILKVLYYTVSPYEITLLRQSLIMVFIQCVLLRIALEFRSKSYNPEYLEPLPRFKNELSGCHILASKYLTTQSEIEEGVPQLIYKTLKSMLIVCYIYISTAFKYFIKLFDVYYQRPLHFWQWPEQIAYWNYILRFFLLFGVLTLLFRESEYYGMFIGTLGLLIESLLPLPQILLFNRLKSVDNFRSILLLSWLGGDFTKIAYLIYGTDKASRIFVLAALLQMCLNTVVAYQYIYFKTHDPPNKNASTLPYSNDETTSGSVYT